MVIVNPRLSLPTDLPYKKRQKPFFPNTPLQQATIRYNEAIRKKYNDIQFAKRLENGSANQNEVVGVNTIDISKLVDPSFFSEMSNMNSLSLCKKRKSKRFDTSPPGQLSIGDIGPNSRSRHDSMLADNARLSNTTTLAMGNDSFATQQTNNSNNSSSYDCNDTEMFPHLQATSSPQSDKTNNNSTAYFTTSIKPPSTSSLEAQAINEYEPTIDSAHDMIFGNVMGMDYGNYIHGPLWTPQQQGCGNNNEQSPSLQTAPPSLCCTAKLTTGTGAYTQPLSHSVPTTPLMYDLNSNAVSNDNGISAVMTPLTVMGKHGGGGRRSTSVPRPRTGTQKETLKQAAIRCGIIKGNHTVATIPKRSHGLVPFQLTPVQSDPVVSVVEIFHPKATINACSSEALVEFEEFKFKTNVVDSNGSEIYGVHNNKSTSALNIAVNVPGDYVKLDELRKVTEKSNSEGHGQVPTTTIEAGSDGRTATRTLENAVSCPTL